MPIKSVLELRNPQWSRQSCGQRHGVLTWPVNGSTHEATTSQRADVESGFLSFSDAQ